MRSATRRGSADEWCAGRGFDRAGGGEEAWAMSALGFIETPFFGITAVVADVAVKSARVRLLGIETTGNENLMIRLAGEVAAVQSALDAAAQRAEAMGAKAVVKCIANPDAALVGLIDFPNTLNPLYGGRDQFLPTDYPKNQNKIMSAKQEALDRNSVADCKR